MLINSNNKFFYKRHFSLKYLIYSLSSFVAVIVLIVYLSPSYEMSFMGFRLSIIVPFFIVIFLLIYCLGRLIIKSKKHALIIALFVVSYLLFRLNGLTHPLFLILLLALFLVVEFLFSQHENSNDSK
jgi:hypothetical protein